MGPYVLGRPIGEGGMSTVYAALQKSALGGGRLVAVKLVGRALADDDYFRALFAREASIATRLEHENVVRTYEVGDVDGELFLVMEFIHGARLSQMQSAPMPLGIALRIVQDLAAGLHAAHELRSPVGEALDLVHLDVSPQNVIVTYEGITKLLDFGVARLGAVDGSRTITVRGKPAYLAPEQIAGGRIDRRTDVFALGVILHELLTGRRLFRRDTPDASYAAILVGEIPDVRALRPDLPGALADVAARALRREPAERFATADALRQHLRAVASTLDLAIASPAAVGTWAARVAPPTFQPADVERALALGQPSGAAEGEPDVFDLPTIAPGLASSTAPAAAARRTPTRAWTAGGLAILALGLAAGAYRLGSGAPREPPAAAPPVVAAEAPREPPAPRTGDAIIEQTPQTPAAPAAHAAPSRGPPRHGRPAGPVAPSTSVPATTQALTRSAHLSVWSSVWGAVSVDGVPLGDSPIVDATVTNGRHVVSVQTAQGTRQQVVVLEPGESGKVRFIF